MKISLTAIMKTNIIMLLLFCLLFKESFCQIDSQEFNLYNNIMTIPTFNSIPGFKDIIITDDMSDEDKECSRKLEYYSKRLEEAESGAILDATNPLTSIGLGIDDLGKYDTCLRLDSDGKGMNKGNSVYFVLDAKSNIKFYHNSYAGICFPVECNNKRGHELAIDFYSNSTYKVYDTAEIINTQELNEKHAAYDASSILIILILIIFILFSIIIGVLPTRFGFSKIPKKEKTPQKKVYMNANVSLAHNPLSPYDDTKNDLSLRTVEASTITNNASKIGNNQINNSLSESNIAIAEERDLTNLQKFISLFNFTDNIKSIFEYDFKKYSPIAIFCGFKVISLFLIIFSATLSILLSGKTRNGEETTAYMKENLFYYFLLAGNIYVNTYFIVGGFFISYNALGKLKTLKDLAIKIGLSVLCVFVLNLVIFLIYIKIIPKFVDSPLSGFYIDNDVENCFKDSNWTGVIFLFSVFSNSASKCFGWTWIAQNDVYLMIIGHVLVYLYNTFERKLVSFISGAALLIIGLVTKILLITLNDFDIFESNSYFDETVKNSDFFDKFFVNPFVRIETLLVGLFFGYLFLKHETNQSKEGELEKNLLSNENEKEGNIGNLTGSDNLEDSSEERVKIGAEIKCKYNNI